MISRRSFVALGAGLCALIVLPLAATAAEANYLFCLPLHGHEGIVSCDMGPSEYCHGPADVPANSQVTVLLFAYYFDELASVQTAFEWDPGWTFLGSDWTCLPGQVTLLVPRNPGGPDAGTVTTGFDCLTQGGWDGAAPVLGRLFFLSGEQGCVRQVESSEPLGTHIADCQGMTYSIRSQWWERTGTICAGSGGNDGCWDPFPVAPSTWGGIKATYRQVR